MARQTRTPEIRSTEADVLESLSNLAKSGTSQPNRTPALVDVVLSQLAGEEKDDTKTVISDTELECAKAMMRHGFQPWLLLMLHRGKSKCQIPQLNPDAWGRIGKVLSNITPHISIKKLEEHCTKTSKRGPHRQNCIKVIQTQNQLKPANEAYEPLREGGPCSHTGSVVETQTVFGEPFGLPVPGPMDSSNSNPITGKTATKRRRTEISTSSHSPNGIDATASAGTGTPADSSMMPLIAPIELKDSNQLCIPETALPRQWLPSVFEKRLCRHIVRNSDGRAAVWCFFPNDAGQGCCLFDVLPTYGYIILAFMFGLTLTTPDGIHREGSYGGYGHFTFSGTITLNCPIPGTVQEYLGNYMHQISESWPPRTDEEGMVGTTAVQVRITPRHEEALRFMVKGNVFDITLLHDQLKGINSIF
ncbi:hypothetical protein S40288_11366 [Stachybotrys chartarum IBT 40288]|nr:hypothetical protein S40288_11366 [Stachybotrys chartarum IBT 40288]